MLSVRVNKVVVVLVKVVVVVVVICNGRFLFTSKNKNTQGRLLTFQKNIYIYIHLLRDETQCSF